MSDEQLELWQGYVPTDWTKKEDPKCGCGTEITMGKVDVDFHSDYCPIVVEHKKKKESNKKLEDLYGVVIT
jgi:hypothetical protein